MTGEKVRVAVIATNNVGWGTIRKTWESHFSKDEEYEFVFFHTEEFAKWAMRVATKTRRFVSLAASIAGRQAAKTAMAADFTKIVVASSHYAAFLPLSGKIEYFIYGDATIRQLESFGLYTLHKANTSSVKGCLQHLLRAVYRFVFDRAVARLAERGHIFLCMSHWYATALVDEHNVPTSQVELLPCCVDTEYWVPSRDTVSPSPLKILFLGSDFVRKGGDMLLEVCGMTEFKDCQFHFVTGAAPEAKPMNAFFHTGMRANTTQLLDLVNSCDLFVLPTRADCSSIALLEAASCGLPTIISDIGGTADLVDDKKTGILLRELSPEAIAEAIRIYRDDRDKLRSHGETARRKVVREFDVGVCLGRLKAVIGGHGKH